MSSNLDNAANLTRRRQPTLSGRSGTNENGPGTSCSAESATFPRQVECQIPFLRRTVRRWQRDGADAEDLVQDTLVQALANAHLWQPGSNLRAWLFTIMRNQFLATVGKASRGASLLQQFAAANPVSAADSREARLVLRDVGAALRRLPNKQRMAVLLAGVEEQSYEEVAETMGLSVGAVRCHLARARDRLRAAIRGADDRSPCIRSPTHLPMPAAVPRRAFVNPPTLRVLAMAE